MFIHELGAHSHSQKDSKVISGSVEVTRDENHNGEKNLPDTCNWIQIKLSKHKNDATWDEPLTVSPPWAALCTAELKPAHECVTTANQTSPSQPPPYTCVLLRKNSPNVPVQISYTWTVSIIFFPFHKIYPKLGRTSYIIVDIIFFLESGDKVAWGYAFSVVSLKKASHLSKRSFSQICCLRTNL